MKIVMLEFLCMAQFFLDVSYIGGSVASCQQEPDLDVDSSNNKFRKATRFRFSITYIRFHGSSSLRRCPNHLSTPRLLLFIPVSLLFQDDSTNCSINSTNGVAKPKDSGCSSFELLIVAVAGHQREAKRIMAERAVWMRDEGLGRWSAFAVGRKSNLRAEM